MADIIYVAVIIAFFAVSVLFVRACDRIIGPEELATGTRDEGHQTEDAATEVAA